MWQYIALISLALAPASPQSLEREFRWPNIVPVHREYYFSDASKAAVDLPVVGTNHKELYWLECRPGGHVSKRGFEFSGDFQCWMGETFNRWDLLHEDLYEGKPWWSRGRFNGDEVWGDCEAYPEWGATRSFRMRAMQVTLRMSRMRFTENKYPKSGPRGYQEGDLGPRLLSFSFEVTVSRDATAVAAQAEPVPFAEPTFRPPSHPGQLLRDCAEPRAAHIPGLTEPRFITEHRLAPPYNAIVEASARYSVRPGPAHSGAFLFSKQPRGPVSEQLKFEILSPDGQKLYQFRCDSLGVSWQTRWITVCSLNREKDSINLLDDAIDLYSRRAKNIILPYQLSGGCKAYPDFGAKRVFRLRGMQLTLQFENVVYDLKADYRDNPVDNPGLKSAVLRIHVTPDAGALAPVGTPSEHVWADSFLNGANCGPIFRAPARTRIQIPGL